MDIARLLEAAQAECEELRQKIARLEGESNGPELGGSFCTAEGELLTGRGRSNGEVQSKLEIALLLLLRSMIVVSLMLLQLLP